MPLKIVTAVNHAIKRFSFATENPLVLKTFKGTQEVPMSELMLLRFQDKNQQCKQISKLDNSIFNVTLKNDNEIMKRFNVDEYYDIKSVDALQRNKCQKYNESQ